MNRAKANLNVAKSTKVGIEKSSNDLVKSDENPKRKFEKMLAKSQVDILLSDTILGKIAPTPKTINEITKKIKDAGSKKCISTYKVWEAKDKLAMKEDLMFFTKGNHNLQMSQACCNDLAFGLKSLIYILSIMREPKPIFSLTDFSPFLVFELMTFPLSKT